jgi:hypothetical protein
MAIDHVTDHGAAAVARMTEALRASGSLTALARAHCLGLQQAEEALQGVLALRWLDTASGAQLDLLGRIVGQPRESRTDDVYRVWLRARVAINRTSGTPEDILRIFRAVIGGGATLVLEEQFPAGFVLRAGYGATLDAVQGAALLRYAKAAGVNAILETPLTDDPAAFAFDPNGAGFDDGTAAVGGVWAEAF